MDQIQTFERIYRRIQMLAGRGRITQVDDSGPVQVMAVQASGLELADKRARVQEFGMTSNPPLGSDAALLALVGDRTAVMVVGVNHQGSRPRNLAPGETKLYSQDGKYIYMTASGGIVVDANGQDVVVNNARDVTWNLSGKLTVTAPGGVKFVAPLVESTGDIQDTSESNDKTMATMREIYDGHTHAVHEVQGGPSTIVSDIPAQQE